MILYEQEGNNNDAACMNSLAEKKQTRVNEDFFPEK